MILTHEDFTAIEAKLGSENAAPIILAFEKIEREQLIEVKKALLMELATKSDVAELRGEIKRVEAEIKVLLKVLIGLVIIAISFFSPVGAELIKLLK